jgi:hypothetical protein
LPRAACVTLCASTRRCRRSRRLSRPTLQPASPGVGALSHQPTSLDRRAHTTPAELGLRPSDRPREPPAQLCVRLLCATGSSSPHLVDRRERKPIRSSPANGLKVQTMVVINIWLFGTSGHPREITASASGGSERSNTLRHALIATATAFTGARAPAVAATAAWAVAATAPRPANVRRSTNADRVSGAKRRRRCRTLRSPRPTAARHMPPPPETGKAPEMQALPDR